MQNLGESKPTLHLPVGRIARISINGDPNNSAENPFEAFYTDLTLETAAIIILYSHNEEQKKNYYSIIHVDSGITQTHIEAEVANLNNITGQCNSLFFCKQSAWIEKNKELIKSLSPISFSFNPPYLGFSLILQEKYINNFCSMKKKVGSLVTLNLNPRNIADDYGITFIDLLTELTLISHPDMIKFTLIQRLNYYFLDCAKNSNKKYLHDITYERIIFGRETNHWTPLNEMDDQVKPKVKAKLDNCQEIDLITLQELLNDINFSKINLSKFLLDIVIYKNNSPTFDIKEILIDSLTQAIKSALTSLFNKNIRDFNKKFAIEGVSTCELFKLADAIISSDNRLLILTKKLFVLTKLPSNTASNIYTSLIHLGEYKDYLNSNHKTMAACGTWLIHIDSFIKFYLCNLSHEKFLEQLKNARKKIEIPVKMTEQPHSLSSLCNNSCNSFIYLRYISTYGDNGLILSALFIVQARCELYQRDNKATDYEEAKKYCYYALDAITTNLNKDNEIKSKKIQLLLAIKEFFCLPISTEIICAMLDIFASRAISFTCTSNEKNISNMEISEKIIASYLILLLHENNPPEKLMSFLAKILKQLSKEDIKEIFSETKTGLVEFKDQTNKSEKIPRKNILDLEKLLTNGSSTPAKATEKKYKISNATQEIDFNNKFNQANVEQSFQALFSSEKSFFSINVMNKAVLALNEYSESKADYQSSNLAVS